MPFGFWARMGPGNDLFGSRSPHEKGQLWGVRAAHCKIQERKNGWSDRAAVWVEDSDGLKELCIRWGPNTPWEEAILRGEGRPVVVIATLCRELCKSGWTDQMSFGIWTWVGSRKHAWWGAHWRHLANTIEPHVWQQCGLLLTLLWPLVTIVIVIFKFSNL